MERRIEEELSRSSGRRRAAPRRAAPRRIRRKRSIEERQHAGERERERERKQGGRVDEDGKERSEARLAGEEPERVEEEVTEQ